MQTLADRSKTSPMINIILSLILYRDGLNTVPTDTQIRTGNNVIVPSERPLSELSPLFLNTSSRLGLPSSSKSNKQCNKCQSSIAIQ